MRPLKPDLMLRSLNELAGVLDGPEHDRVLVAVRARRTVLNRRRARHVRALAHFLTPSR